MSGPPTSRLSLSEHLQAVTEALAATRTAQGVFAVVLTPALEALGAAQGAVLLVGEAGDRLEVAATQGHAEGAPTVWRTGPLDGGGPAGDALGRREALYFEHRGDLARAYPGLEARTSGAAAVASAVLPMFLDGAPLGVLVLDFREPHTFPPEEKGFLRTLAAQCAVALGRARLLDEQARSAGLWQGSHERLVLTLQAGGFGLWELDVESGLLRRSPETMGLLGLAAPVGSVADFLDRVHPGDRPAVEEAFARALGGGAAHFLIRHRFTRGDGREIWLEQHTRVERDGAGRATRLLGVTADITARHAAGAQLQASEARFRRLVEASPVGIAAGDAGGRLVLVNDAYLRLLGFTRAEFGAGEIDWVSLTPPEEREADERAFRQALEEGVSAPYTKEMLTRSGERLPVGVVLTRYEEEGEPLVVGYLQDLRPQRAAERALREHGAELERQVRERTAEAEAARERAEVLAALGEALQTATAPGEVAALALDRLGPALRAQSMLVVRLDGAAIRLPTLWGDTPPVITAHMTRPGLTLRETPLLHRVAAGGVGLYLDDYRAEPGTLASFPSLAGGAEPIRRPDGTLEGFLVVWRPVALGAWLPPERDLLRRAAGTLGLALERAARARQIKEEARAQEAFVAFSEAAGGETDLRALAEQATRVLRAYLEQVSVAYYEREGELWRARVWSDDVSPEVAAQIQAGVPLDAPNFAGAVHSPAGLFVDGWDAGANHLGSTEGYGAVALLPIRLGGEVRSLFAVGTQYARVWTGRERALVRAVGRSLGLVLERAHVAERLETQNAELEARTRALEGFADLTRDLAVQGDPRVFVRRAQEAALSLLAPGYALYYERGGDRWRNRVQVGEVGHPDLQAFIDAGPPVGQTPSVDVPWTTGQPYYQDAYARGSDTPAAMVQHVSTVASLPVSRRGEVVGVFITVLFEGRAWTRTDRVVLETVVRSLSLALERAEGVGELSRRTEELARSNAELEQFAYVASHDLQAPIRAVTSFAGIVDRRYGDRLDDRGRLYLRQIVEGGEHMKRLVDDLLAFSRVHTGQRELRPVEVGAVFDTVRARLQGGTEALGAEVSREPLPVVRADAQQLDQLLQNLIANGLKYRREDVPPRVHVTAERDGELWRFAVADNGIGIEGQYFERIFVIFQRLHGREEYEGTGIGLAVCKKIVERHGGRLWLESTPGQGSTFYFTLPAV